MKQLQVNGWRIEHETDRTMLLIKDHPGFRHYCEGRLGYVLVRGDPGITKWELWERAWSEAEKQDAELGLRIARDTIPAEELARQRFERHGVITPESGTGVLEVRPIREYHHRQSQMREWFSTPEDPQIRIYKP
jgi:hypothetical protein